MKSVRIILWVIAGVVTATSVGAVGFVFDLSGAQEVPRVATQARAECVSILADDNDPPILTIQCESVIDGEIAAHVHRGLEGENGPIVLTFPDPEDLSASWPLSEAEVALLLTESLYVNLHTAAHPAGELRGQIRFQSLIDAGEGTRFIPLEGMEVVPAVLTDDGGRCVVALDFESADGVEVTAICHHDVSDPIAAHIHRGARGSNGPIVIDLGDPASPIFFNEDLDTPDLVGDFRRGDLYVQIHSATDPAGALRGQVDTTRASGTTLSLNKSRFEVAITWADSLGRTGEGQAVRETGDSGFFWFFNPDNAEMLVKVLDACSTRNHFWVFAAATTNIGYTLTVTDTESGEVRVYENPVGQMAMPILDTVAFTTCP